MSRKATDTSLTAILQRQTTALVEDLRLRTDKEAAIKTKLDTEYKSAREGRRTAATYSVWREDVLPQVAVAWVLACVFVRFLEDNELIESPRLSGPVSPVDRRKHAIEAQEKYFQANPTHNERDFLESVFHDIARLPGMTALLGKGNASLWRFGPSREGCVELLKLFRELDAGEEPKLRYDLRDAEFSTRFLGDLYQNLSDHARKQYALLQTPDFVEEFILDRTLEPAIREFGLQGLKMIDPTVGSGHFLLGGFARLFDRWRAAEPATEPRVLAQRVLDSLYGVDLNPFAAEICRFRLLIVALKASGVKRLANAPAFKIHVAIGDSLLHGPRYGDTGRAQEMFEREWVMGFTYEHEDVDELRRVFGQRYHVVVGNPPYITVKDKSMNALIRERYGSCKGHYALSVPFLERFVELAIPVDGAHAAGFIGQITANSFMKREFGKKLIEEFIPRWDLTHVIDTSGAYIPGHGTPTVILFLQNQRPVAKTVRAVLGIRGEPTTPDDAAQGRVWLAIVDQVDQPGSQSEYVSVEDKERAGFHQHPWSIGGGGAADLKDVIDSSCEMRLGDIAVEIGSMAVTREDEAYTIGLACATRNRIPVDFTRPLVEGDGVRDWSIDGAATGLWPYSSTTLEAEAHPSMVKFLWPLRSGLRDRVAFGLSQEARGLAWFAYSMFFAGRYRTPMSIAYAEIATHNHFVLDRGGKVFNRTAPVIKLPPGATEDDHLALLGLLNSSTACFWLQQVCHNKGGPGGGSSKDEKWKDFYAHSANRLSEMPLPSDRPLELARGIQVLADRLAAELSPKSVVAITRTQADLDQARECWEQARGRMIALQEELDWHVYRLFGLTSEDFTAPEGALPALHLGERAFEILLARQVERGEVQTRWFEWCRAQPTREIPGEWLPAYKRVVERRIVEISKNSDVQLIEQMSFKRRWEHVPFMAQVRSEARDAVLNRLELLPLWTRADLAPASVARLLDLVGNDLEILRLSQLYAGASVPDLGKLLTEILSSEHVPYLAPLRYTESGLRKRTEWEKTWALQREEDTIEARVELPIGNPRRLTAPQVAEEKARVIGDIPVPPKYISADFQQSSYWSNRGKLDVPKERFISYPGASTEEDPTLLVGWAGWDHSQQAQALATLYRERQQMGWDAVRLRPMLAGLQELVPWLAQWHGKDPTFGDLGEFYRAYIETQCRELGLQVHALADWRPPAKGRGRKAQKQIEAADEAASLFEAE